LKAAILLGQQMAEQEAIAMLAAKVRQVLPDDRKHDAEEVIRRLLEQLLGSRRCDLPSARTIRARRTEKPY
jgi:hypothetical protein